MLVVSDLQFSKAKGPPVRISHSWSGISGNGERSSGLGEASGARCVRKPKSEIGRKARLVDSEDGVCW